MRLPDVYRSGTRGTWSSKATGMAAITIVSEQTRIRIHRGEARSPSIGRRTPQCERTTQRYAGHERIISHLLTHYESNMANKILFIGATGK